MRHRVLALLRRRGLLSQERIELLLSWKRSGFSVHNRVFVHPRDGRKFEALVRYMMRPPVSLSRLHFTPALVDRILDHLRKRDKISRPPPLSSQLLASPA